METDEVIPNGNEQSSQRRKSIFQTDEFVVPTSPVKTDLSGSERFGDKKSIISMQVSEENLDKSVLESSSGSWQTLRRKILLDLHRHFRKKVDHDRLISCLCKFLMRMLATDSVSKTKKLNSKIYAFNLNN